MLHFSGKGNDVADDTFEPSDNNEDVEDNENDDKDENDEDDEDDENDDDENNKETIKIGADWADTPIGECTSRVSNRLCRTFIFNPRCSDF